MLAIRWASAHTGQNQEAGGTAGVEDGGATLVILLVVEMECDQISKE